MKKNFLLLYVIFHTISTFSQITFEKGYFINNSGTKIECFIKNIDWRNNPTDFEYKISKIDNVESIDIELVKEFNIYNASKYIRKTVNIDRSSNKIHKLSKNKKANFKKEQVFLKPLIEGEANLYLYEEGTLKRFFYNIKNSEIEQLVFKKYIITDNKIGENSRFKQQLWTDLKCSSIDMNTINELQYKNKSLIHFFNKYNSCNNSDYTNFEIKKIEIYSIYQ